MATAILEQADAMSGVDNPAKVVEQAFETCSQAFCRYFTVRLGRDVHLVDDLMQQLWLRARLKADDLRADNPEPWLWRIAQNLLREHRRRQRRLPSDSAIGDPTIAAALAQRFEQEELPEEVLARKEIQDQLLLALTELPSADQELLIGCYFHGHSQFELADHLHITVRAVEGRLYRARLALRDKLARLEQ